MNIREVNQNNLKAMESLEKGWYDPECNHGEKTSELSLNYAKELLNVLPEDFMVFPLCDGFVQLECDRDNKYLEISIYDEISEIFTIDEAKNEYNFSCDSDSIDVITDFVNNFFKMIPLICLAPNIFL